MNSCHLASHFRSGVGATQARPPVSETLREWSRRPSETGLGDPPRVVSETLRDRSRRVSETDIYDMEKLHIMLLDEWVTIDAPIAFCFHTSLYNYQI